MLKKSQRFFFGLFIWFLFLLSCNIIRSMKNFILQKTYICILYVALTLCMEVFLFVQLDFGFFPEYVVFTLAWVFFFCALLFSFPSLRFTNAFVSIILAFQILIGYVNICVHNTLNDVFSLSMLTLVGETAEVLTLDMFPILPIFFYIGILMLFIVGLLSIAKIKVTKAQVTRASHAIKNVLVVVVLTLCLGMYSVQTAMLPTYGAELCYLDDQSLYTSFYSGKESLKKFGSYGFYIEQLGRLIYNPFDKQDAITKDEALAYLETQEYTPEDLAIFGACEGSNVLSIMAESFEWYVISPELTPTLYALSTGHNFATNGTFYTITTQENGSVTLQRNDHMPSADNVGFVLSNYYSKAKTDYSETSFILGSYPYNKSYTSRLSFADKGLYSNISYNFSLPNQLVLAGAVDTTLYVHPYKASFYGRDTLVKRFGFKQTMFIENMPEVKQDSGLRLAHATLDSEVVKAYASQLMPVVQNEDGSLQTFYTHFTTISTHGEYTSDHPLISQETKDLVKAYVEETYHLTEVDIVGSEDYAFYTFVLKALDTEYMLAYIINYLTTPQQVYTTNGEEVEGRTEILIDNTLLVFFADHQSYYSSLDTLVKPEFYVQGGEFTNALISQFKQRISAVNYLYAPQRYNVPACIYSTRINEETIDGYRQTITKFTQAFDLTPTVLALLGVAYNPNYYLGYPVMCEVENTTTGEIKDVTAGVLVSHTGGMFSQTLYADNGIDVLYNVNHISSEQAIIEFSIPINDYIRKWKCITALYEYNLFTT